MDNGQACVILALQKSCLINLHVWQIRARKKYKNFGEAFINMNVVNINKNRILRYNVTLRYC